jgi:hypothetical protein
MAFGCFDTVPFTWGTDPKCLLELSRELARPPQFPIGTPVRILEIRRHDVWLYADEAKEEVALLRVGQPSKAVNVFANWPQVLRMLEEIDGVENKRPRETGD